MVGHFFLPFYFGNEGKMRKINIKVKIVILLLVLIGVGLFMVRTGEVLGYTIDTLNITRQIPNPPPPPTKPEPPCPPPCATPTPTSPPAPTPTIPSEVTPTPTPTLPPGITPTPTPLPGEGGPPGPGEPPVCGATVPPAPTLLSVNPVGSGQVDLTWTAVDPATHYSISYGLTSGNYIYSVSNTGNVTSFTVGGLDPAADYCFAIRAVNGCAPSGLSNEICPGAVVGQVLGVSTLGVTGDSVNQLLQILFIIGSVCLASGLKLFLPAKKLA